MVTSVQSGSTASSNTAFNQKKKLVRLPLDVDEQAEARLKLTAKLQTTLDLRELLELFLRQLRELLPVDGLEYSNTAKGINMPLGRKGIHSCDYRLITQQDNLGALVFSRSKRFSEAELAAVEMLVGTLIYPLRNALLYRDAVQTAMRDPLTGTGNRVALDNALHRELQLAHRYGQDVALLVIDIDHFKQVNDSFGHTRGDEVLRCAARNIEALIRQTDMTFRYGGEEFVVILSKTDESGARVIAERIRETIEQTPINTVAGDIRITASIGISALVRGENVKELFDRADRALYRAKQSGRNRVKTGHREVTSIAEPA